MIVFFVSHAHAHLIYDSRLVSVSLAYPNLCDVTSAVLGRFPHVEDEVRPLIAWPGVRIVLDDLRTVMIGVDVIAKVLHALLPILPSRS